MKLLLILLVFPISLQAQELADPFLLLKSGEFTVYTKAGIYLEEHEYEISKVVQDKFEYEHNFYVAGANFGIPGSRVIGLEVSFEDRGLLTKRYAPNLGLQAQNVQYKGFHAAEIFFRQHFEVANDKNELAFEIRTKGSPLRGKETNNTYQGKDLILELLYSHMHNEEWKLYGKIHTEVVGKKKIIKYDGEEEVADAYSVFGSLVGIQWLSGKYWLDMNGLFYLTTDYNSSSPSYSRYTDKGFIIGGRLLAGYYVASNTALIIEHIRQGSNFNVITETTTNAKEFEIEEQSTSLGVSWFF